MTHKSSHVNVRKAAPEGSTDIVRQLSVDLVFPPDTPLDAKLKKVRQVERLLDKLDHDEDDQDG